MRRSLQAARRSGMLRAMQTLDFDRASVSAGLAKASGRKAAAMAEYEAATAELDWWTQGAHLFGLDVPTEARSEASELDDLFGKRDGRPTLRQAILAFMKEAPRTAVTVPELAALLKARGWVPDREDPQKAVSDMAAAMAADDQLAREGRGVYRLHPRLAMALESRSATDQRRAELRDAILAIVAIRPLHASAIRETLVETGILAEDEKAYLVLRGTLSQLFMAGELARVEPDTYVRVTDLETFEKGLEDAAASPTVTGA